MRRSADLLKEFPRFVLHQRLRGKRPLPLGIRAFNKVPFYRLQRRLPRYVTR